MELSSTTHIFLICEYLHSLAYNDVKNKYAWHLNCVCSEIAVVYTETFR